MQELRNNVVAVGLFEMPMGKNQVYDSGSTTLFIQSPPSASTHNTLPLC